VREYYLFFLGVLAVWRVTHLLTAEDGPFRVIARLRRAAGRSFLGLLLDCFYCLSLWVAAPFASWIAGNGPYWGLVWLALSGGACLLERLTVRRNEPMQITYYESKELDEHELLRQ
jgi:hypothetical protein